MPYSERTLLFSGVLSQYDGKNGYIFMNQCTNYAVILQNIGIVLDFRKILNTIGRIYLGKAENPMNKIYIPDGYKSNLDAYDTQRAIAYIKETFQEEFSKALNLKRVSAPLFVTENSGLNDNLNGFERAVSFDIPAVGADAQVVRSLAKWKRLALKRYHFTLGNGLYTDMNAIRRDEDLDNVHSIYVDQWDWEKVITRENRNSEYLKLIVRAIVRAI